MKCTAPRLTEHEVKNLLLAIREGQRKMYDNTVRHGLTQQDQHNLLQSIGLFVKQYVQGALDAERQLRDNKIAALEQRIAELELHGIRDMGGWQRPVNYSRGDLVSCNGQIWIASVDTSADEKPGESTKWRLARRSPEQERQRRATQPRTQSTNVAGDRRP